MTHPALLMIKIWAACILMYAVLPFHLVDKALTLQGFVVLFLFLSAFCLGTVLVGPFRQRRSPASLKRIDVSRAETLLAAVAFISIAAFLLDLRDKNVLDLAVAYELRSDQAAALLGGEASSSALAFQVGFLTYPAAYAYMVQGIAFVPRPSIWRLSVFGALPVLLATLAMGGRSPLLYGIVVLFLSSGARRIYLNHHDRSTAIPHKVRRLGIVKALSVTAIVLGATYYFVAVFFARAELFGGGEGMFKVAEDVWGVGFRGPMADVMFRVMGQEWAYIVFVFIWYVVQGPLMANFLFSDYQGPMQLGVYGVDLVSALVRRLDGATVARYFDELQQIGVYGFFPSAWGSLYVDLWFFGLAVSAVWGVLAALVYRKIQLARDSRWLMLAPFVTTGIVFSFINTPIGFANGLVTHLWLIAAFLALRKRTSSAQNGFQHSPQARRDRPNQTPRHRHRQRAPRVPVRRRHGSRACT